MRLTDNEVKAWCLAEARDFELANSYDSGSEIADDIENLVSYLERVIADLKALQVPLKRFGKPFTPCAQECRP